MDDESRENKNDELAACGRSNRADTLLPLDGVRKLQYIECALSDVTLCYARIHVPGNTNVINQVKLFL